MKGALNGSSLAGGTPVRGRVGNDYYATPPESTQALLNVLELNGSILEPACGEGHISEVLKNNYPNSEIVSTDMIDRGYGEGCIDFLEHTYDRTFTNVITNPPFKYMREFVEKALEISDDKVVMFGKIQFLESKGRQEFLMKSPLKYIYVFSERQNPLRNGESVDENGKNGRQLCASLGLFGKRVIRVNLLLDGCNRRRKRCRDERYSGGVYSGSSSCVVATGR